MSDKTNPPQRPTATSPRADSTRDELRRKLLEMIQRNEAIRRENTPE